MTSLDRIAFATAIALIALAPHGASAQKLLGLMKVDGVAGDPTPQSLPGTGAGAPLAGAAPAAPAAVDGGSNFIAEHSPEDPLIFGHGDDPRGADTARLGVTPEEPAKGPHQGHIEIDSFQWGMSTKGGDPQRLRAPGGMPGGGGLASLKGFASIGSLMGSTDQAAHGGAGRDVLIVGQGRDVLGAQDFGGAGNDVIIARGTDSTGGVGVVPGGAGNDRIILNHNVGTTARPLPTESFSLSYTKVQTAPGSGSHLPAGAPKRLNFTPTLRR